MPVATPTLTIADLANGSQATATISGATTGTTNTVYAQAVRDTGSTSWTSLGSLVGNGEVVVAPGTGYFWFHVSSTDGSTSAVSNLVYAACSDGEDAIHKRLWDAVTARIQQLEMSEIPPSRVYQQVFFNESDIEFPCVCVVLEGVQGESEGIGTAGRDDPQLGIMVVILTRGGINQTTYAPMVLKVREQCMRALRRQRIGDLIPEVHDAVIVPQPIFTPKNENAEMVYSAFEVRFTSRQSRGLT